jgi:hypothetical protein
MCDSGVLPLPQKIAALKYDANTLMYVNFHLQKETPYVACITN